MNEGLEKGTSTLVWRKQARDAPVMRACQRAMFCSSTRTRTDEEGASGRSRLRLATSLPTRTRRGRGCAPSRSAVGLYLLSRARPSTKLSCAPHGFRIRVLHTPSYCPSPWLLLESIATRPGPSLARLSWRAAQILFTLPHWRHLASSQLGTQQLLRTYMLFSHWHASRPKSSNSIAQWCATVKATSMHSKG